MITYNINTMVEVKLTEYGKKILVDHYTKYDQKDYILDKISPNDVYKAELWHVMNIFGECLWMGNNKIPFKQNNISFTEISFEESAEEIEDGMYRGG